VTRTAVATQVSGNLDHGMASMFIVRLVGICPVEVSGRLWPDERPSMQLRRRRGEPTRFGRSRAWLSGS
jgi:hypothetical protein